jgi:hypothetical protein
LTTSLYLGFALSAEDPQAGWFPFALIVPAVAITVFGFWMARRLGGAPTAATFVGALGAAFLLSAIGFDAAGVGVAFAAGISGSKSWRHFRQGDGDAAE